MGSTAPTRRGWTPGRVRRANMFAVLLVVCALTGLWSTHQPWFAWATPGIAPGCSAVPAGSPTVTVQSASGALVPGIAARGCITGADLTASTVGAVGTPAGTAAASASLTGPYDRGAPADLLGLPRTATLLVGCLLLAAFATATRRGYLAIPALMMLQMANQDLGVVRTLYLTGNAANLTAAQPGLQMFTWALLAGSALTLTGALFVLKVNFEERAQARRIATESGAQAPSEPLDPVTNYIGRKLSRVKHAAAEATAQISVTP